MMIVLDVEAAEVDLAAGRLSCPHCPGTLRAWSWAPARRVRRHGAATQVLRPRRGRCARCRRTQVLLPSWCLPRRADALDVIGAALVASADGRGHRRIAADLGRPASTVRRWLRRVRGTHLSWLYRRGVETAYAHDPAVLNRTKLARNAMGDMLTALSAAVVAIRGTLHRARRRQVEAWPLIGVITRGRLLTPL